MGEWPGASSLTCARVPTEPTERKVQKLFVHTSARRRGFGRALMAAIEQEARNARRWLLYLDTESHKPAEAMYRRLGWLPVGEIPDYALSPDGHLRGTMIFYKKIAA